METATAPCTHDAFISYSHEDKDWVTSRLLTPLEAAGVRVYIDYRDFVPGAPSVENMERAVELSRHTLVVLTPAWVMSEWTAFEALLLTTDDPVGRRRRLIPLMVRTCTPPKYIKFLSYVDLTEPAHHEAQLARVIGVLRPQATGAGGQATPVAHAGAPVAGEPVRQGVEALSRLMQVPEVRDALVGFDTLLRDVFARIEVLASYKDVHDTLHRLQRECHDALLREARGFPDDEIAYENVAQHALAFQTIVADLSGLATRHLLPELDLSRIDKDLDGVARTLERALTEKDPKAFASTIRSMGRILAVHPSRINTRLNDTARALRLADLARALRIVLLAAREAKLDQGKVRTFEIGVAGLESLAGNLARLVEEHDRWQMIDIELRPVSASFQQSNMGLEESWPLMKEQLSAIAATEQPWAVSLMKEVGDLDRALVAEDAARTRASFRRLQRLAGDRFFRVDLALKGQCDELRKVCDPLAAILKILE